MVYNTAKVSQEIYIIEDLGLYKKALIYVTR